MQIHLKGVEKRDQESVRHVILSCMEAHGVVYNLWTWDWENPVEITDGEGNLVGEGVNIELPGTEAIRAAVEGGLLEDISNGLPRTVVYLVMAPIEVGYEGKRL